MPRQVSCVSWVLINVLVLQCRSPPCFLLNPLILLGTDSCPFLSLNFMRTICSLCSRTLSIKAHPSSCPSEIAATISQCWLADPTGRPAFADLTYDLVILRSLMSSANRSLLPCVVSLLLHLAMSGMMASSVPFTCRKFIMDN
jgi:hypothetical protein